MSDTQIRFRVAIVGSNRARVAKVLSLLISDSCDETSPSFESSSSSSSSSFTTCNAALLPDFPEEVTQRQIHVEYIPCTATFDSYQNEINETVRYLAKLEHHGKDGKSRGSSLAPFFDEILDDNNNKNHGYSSTNDCHQAQALGIAAVAIGCGIESKEEVSMISSFIRTLSGLKTITRISNVEDCDGGNDEGNNDSDGKIFVECIQPNEEYSSMKEETIAYKNLTPLEKEEVTKEQLIGPGKMAKFTKDVAILCIPRTRMPTEEKEEIERNIKDGTETETIQKEEVVEEDPMSKLKDYDPNTIRFACKMCRTILFGECDLEDPPHSKSQHSFSSRKMKHGANRSTNQCQSVFLATGMDWMVGINDAAEGKLACPRCSGKLGLYKWHGTQCSCGSWVTPAIQIHSSRVDVVPPENERRQQDPLAQLMSPLARLHVAGQPGI